jgi:hypothetical protein
MPADPVEAGRKGGKSRSAAKLAAIRRNGFQKRAPVQEQPADLQPGCGCIQTLPAVLIPQQPKEGQ